MNLDDFKKSVDELPKNDGVQFARPDNSRNIVPIKKNTLLSYVSDATGCGHIRNIFPMTYLNALFGKDAQIMPIITPTFIWQEDILVRTKSILFQRQMSPEHLRLIARYKEIQPRFGF